MGSKFSSMTELQGTYSVFTGTDIYTVFQDQIISTMQGISYSITRQKAPIYTMGSPDPRAIARSKRGIAGSMIMTTFDRHALAEFMKDSEFASKKGSMESGNANPWKKDQNFLATDELRGNFVQTLPPDQMDSALDVAGRNNALAAGAGFADSMSQVSTPMFTDQLLPFDSTLMGSNEYGISSVMRVYGLEILNEGSGVSIDDTSNEVQMTYISRLITPWINQAPVNNTQV